MPHPAAADPAAHADHDTILVATYAAGDAAGAELEAATTLVAACPDCAALHQDLRAIAAALPALPAPRRPRDFRLTPAQAAALRPAGWRRLLAPLAGPRFAFASPLGSGLAALGIVGVLLAGPGLPMGGPTAAGPASTAAPAEAPSVAAPDPEGGFTGITSATAGPAAQGGEVPPADAGAEPTPPTASGKAAVQGVEPSRSAAPDAPATSAPAVPGEVAAPSDAAEPAGEAVRLDSADGAGVSAPANAGLMALAAAMLLAGLTIAGLRMVSRRLA